MRRRLSVLLLSMAACVPDGTITGRLSRTPLADAGFTITDSGVVVDASGPDAAVVVDAGSPEDASTVDTGPVDSGPPDMGNLCAMEPVKPPGRVTNVYYGTPLPTHVNLTAGQVLAVGSFNGCSGTLVTDNWILSADHCRLNTRSEFCMGTQADNPNVCIRLARVVAHRSADIVLAELAESASSRMPGVEPIALFADDFDSSWIGTTAEAAGYGQQENGGFNEREFTAEPISGFQGDFVTINGQGQRGVCFGDSGGPVMVTAADGTTRVAGALSYGDPSCLGRDNYTRVDLVRSWAEGLIGPIAPPLPEPCGNVTVEGSCNADRSQAEWCAPGDILTRDVCKVGDVCAYDTSQSGFRCVPVAQDPCGGVSSGGQCDSNVLSWCEGARVLRTRDCGVCEESCVPETDDRSGPFNCVPSTCGDLDFLGRCQGNVAEWCTREGELETRDCAQNGQSCGYVDSETGYFCR